VENADYGWTGHWPRRHPCASRSHVAISAWTAGLALLAEQSNESAFQRSAVSASKRRHSGQTLLVTMPTWPNQTKLQFSGSHARVMRNPGSHALGEGYTGCLSVFLPIGPSGGVWHARRRLARACKSLQTTVLPQISVMKRSRLACSNGPSVGTREGRGFTSCKPSKTSGSA
jgi:hypothetical protein